MELSFLVQPVAPDNSKLLVPLGKLEVTSCSISIVMSMLHFTGSMLQGALQGLESGLERFINDQLPAVACSQLKPLLEKQASAALSSILVQLEPLLTTHPPLPPEPRAPQVPLIDWESYPPSRLLRALVERRPQEVAKVIQRTAAQRIPLPLSPISND